MFDEQLTREFCNHADAALAAGLRQIDKCLALLTPEQAWNRPNEVSNSIGNLLLHLNGNVRKRILDTVAGEPFDRDRDAEFATRSGSVDDAQTILQATVEQARTIIRELPPQRLVDRVDVMGTDTSVIALVSHVVEHFQLHVGQVISQTKLLTGLDLTRYDDTGNLKT